ncbi:PREDICTED: zinc finger protein 580 [Chaetura pelagica]|uniref:zinc finger protein 580 n=1 Tax=Chaetura pelagica TaxID=8897 RepID=UPI0005232DF1|nr:PREDICTED: zinc finger protein 580 [Chaetura pelagica]
MRIYKRKGQLSHRGQNCASSRELQLNEAHLPRARCPLSPRPAPRQPKQRRKAPRQAAKLRNLRARDSRGEVLLLSQPFQRLRKGKRFANHHLPVNLGIPLNWKLEKTALDQERFLLYVWGSVSLVKTAPRSVPTPNPRSAGPGSADPPPPRAPPAPHAAPVAKARSLSPPAEWDGAGRGPPRPPDSGEQANSGARGQRSSSPAPPSWCWPGAVECPPGPRGFPQPVTGRERPHPGDPGPGKGTGLMGLLLSADQQLVYLTCLTKAQTLQAGTAQNRKRIKRARWSAP